MKDRAPILEALKHPNVRAFLFVIRAGEGTSDNDGYRRMFGGELFDVSGGWYHPHRVITKTHGGKPISSSAAGAYQFLSKTWRSLQEQYGIESFDPAWQDFGAVALIAGRKALDALLAGRLDEAITRCNREWASLPGSPYGQPTISLAKCREVYFLHGGNVADPAERPKEVIPMAPFLAAAIPALLQAAPDLIRLFGKGENSQKNAVLAEKVGQVAIQVTGAINEQEAAQRIASDPEAAANFKAAVAENFDQWMGMVVKFAEMDENSRAKAREFALNYSRDPVLGKLTFVEILSLLFVVLSSAGGGYVLYGDFPPELKGAVVTIILIGGFTGVKEFWLGSSNSSQRKDDKR